MSRLVLRRNLLSPALREVVQRPPPERVGSLSVMQAFEWKGRRFRKAHSNCWAMELSENEKGEWIDMNRWKKFDSQCEVIPR